MTHCIDAQTLEAARQQAEICKIFANVNRVLIVWVLGTRGMSVGDIAAAINATLPNTSQHLRLMKDKGILASRRKGHTVYYHVVAHHLHGGGWLPPRTPRVRPAISPAPESHTHPR